MSKRRPAALSTMIRPRTRVDPPKYSPTIAPMRLSVVASFIAVKKYGKAFGIRTLRRICHSLAAVERISSMAAGSTWTRPRVTFAMTGKNTRTAAMTILDSGFSSPNQLFISGAKAMIGTALAATARGSSTPRAVAQRAVANATTTPATVPITRPPRASMSVAWADASRPNRVLFRFWTSAVTIADGRGRMNAWRPSPPTMSSHARIPATKTRTAGR